MFYLFGHKACEILAPQPGIEPAPPALKGEALTSDHQGSPHSNFFMKSTVQEGWGGLILQ